MSWAWYDSLNTGEVFVCFDGILTLQTQLCGGRVVSVLGGRTHTTNKEEIFQDDQHHISPRSMASLVSYPDPFWKNWEGVWARDYGKSCPPENKPQVTLSTLRLFFATSGRKVQRLTSKLTEIYQSHLPMSSANKDDWQKMISPTNVLRVFSRSNRVLSLSRLRCLVSSPRPPWDTPSLAYFSCLVMRT